jgi:hypothetical protein
MDAGGLDHTERSDGGRFFQTLVLIPRIVSSATSVGMPGADRIAWACWIDMAGQPGGRAASDIRRIP